MKVTAKLLNGDLFTINIDEESKVSLDTLDTQIINELSKQLDIPFYRIKIIKLNEYEYEYAIFIEPNIVNLYELDVINTFKFSSLCMNLCKDYSIELKNNNILKYIIDHNIVYKMMCEHRPHPMIVDYVINDISTRQIMVPKFSENPSDKALDFLFDNPEYISKPVICRNTNRRAIEYVMNNIDKSNCYDLWYNTLCTHPYKDVIEFVINRHHVNTHILCEFLRIALKNVDSYKYTNDEEKKENIEYIYSLLESNFTIIDYSEKIRIMATSSNPKWLKEYIEILNEKNLSSDFSDFLKNPHPIAVEWIINNYTRLDKEDFLFLFKNTNDLVVSFLQKECLGKEFELSFQNILSNSNEILVEYSIKYISIFLSKKWETLKDLEQLRIFSLIMKNKNKEVRKAVINTKEIMNKLSCKQKILLCADLEDVYVDIIKDDIEDIQDIQDIEDNL